MEFWTVAALVASIACVTATGFLHHAMRAAEQRMRMQCDLNLDLARKYHADAEKVLNDTVAKLHTVHQGLVTGLADTQRRVETISHQVELQKLHRPGMGGRA